MHVVILGSGVIGVTSAYFLRKAGCEVTVIDRNSATALESSHSNGSQLSYSQAYPLSSYGNIMMALGWLGRSDAPLLVRPMFDPDMFLWLAKFLNEARSSKYYFNISVMAKLAYYSKAVLAELMNQEKFDFNWGNKGLLNIIEKESEVKSYKKKFDYLSTISEVEYKFLNKQECIELEPASEFLMQKRFAAFHAVNDEIGDIYKFTTQLEQICKDIGVKFIYNANVKEIKSSTTKVQGVVVGNDFITADQYVIAAGAETNNLLMPLGVNLDIYPVKGYSISVKVSDNNAAPISTITDHKVKTVYTRMGDTLRISGTAEFTGYDRSLNQERLKPMLELARSSFPNSSNFLEPIEWSCLRPLTPSGRPIISNIKYSNLFVNSGHGFLGWTQAFGSAKLLKQIVLGEKTDIDMIGLYRLTN